MLADPGVMFLLDVDNTLLDNDRFRSDLGARPEHLFGAVERTRYWENYDELRGALGYADCLTTLQRFRVGLEDDPDLLQMSEFVLEYPFAECARPHALEVIAHLRTQRASAVLSDGDVVLQPRKIQPSGIRAAVDGRVLVYVHKEQSWPLRRRVGGQSDRSRARSESRAYRRSARLRPRHTTPRIAANRGEA